MHELHTPCPKNFSLERNLKKMISAFKQGNIQVATS